MPAAESATILLRCLSLDLEVGKEDGRIHAFGAVRAVSTADQKGTTAAV